MVLIFSGGFRCERVSRGLRRGDLNVRGGDYGICPMGLEAFDL